MRSRSRFRRKSSRIDAFEVALVAVDDHRLDQLDPIAEPVEDLEVLIDHRVEERVEKEAAGRELAFAKPLLHEHPRAGMSPSCTVTIAFRFTKMLN